MPRGGKRPGAGRPLDWLKEHTREIIRKDKLVERLAKIASGQNIDQPLTNGEIVPFPAPVAEQRKAILDLLERGYGKPEQMVDMVLTDAGERPTADELLEMRARLMADRARTEMDRDE